MALTVTLNWKNTSVNITKQAIYFGDENTQTLLDGNVSASATSFVHELPPEIVDGQVYYRVSSIVDTADGPVEETSTVLSVDLDVNKGFIFTTTATNYQIVSLTAFQAYFADGTVVLSTEVEAAPGVFAHMMETNQVAGRTRLVPVTGNTFHLLNINNTITTIESWGGYEYLPEESLTMSPRALTINLNELVGVPSDAPNMPSYYRLFSNATLLNDPNLCSWDVSNVTDMNGMFLSCTALNQPLGVWNTSSATDMTSMFAYATVFNQDLSQWCVPNIDDNTIQGSMFEGSAMSPEFKPVGNSCPRGEVQFLKIVDNNTYAPIVGIGDPVEYTLDFYTNVADTPIWTSSNETVLTVTDGKPVGVSPGTATVTLQVGALTSTIDLEVREMQAPMIVKKLAGETNLHFSLSLSGTRERSYFEIRDSFGLVQPVWIDPNGTQDVFFSTNGTDESIVEFHSPFDPLPFVSMARCVEVIQWPGAGWDTLGLGYAIQTVPATLPTNVTKLNGMFASAETFNQDISGWDVSRIDDFDQMFTQAIMFNQPIGSWDVSSAQNMRLMFSGASAFNQDIGAWDTSKCVNMQEMMANTSTFDQDLSQWCVPGDVLNYNFANGSSLQLAHFPVWGTCPRGEVPVVTITSPDGPYTVGNTYQFTYNYNQDPGTVTTVEWSSNTGAVTVDNTGLMTAVSEGDAFVTVTINGTVTNRVYIVVSA